METVDAEAIQLVTQGANATNQMQSAQVLMQDVPQESKLNTANAFGSAQNFSKKVDGDTRSLWCRAWNSNSGVRIGHFLQGLFGVAAFRACYDRVVGETGARDGLMRVSYDPTLKNYKAGWAADSRSLAQARIANRAEQWGMFNPIGVSLSAVTALTGLVVGGIVRLCQGGPITEDDLHASLNKHGGAENACRASQQDLAARLCNTWGVQSVAEGLRIVTSASPDQPDPDTNPEVRAFRATHHFVFQDKADLCDNRRPRRVDYEFTLALNLLYELHLRNGNFQAPDEAKPIDNPAFKRDLNFICQRYADVGGLAGHWANALKDQPRHLTDDIGTDRVSPECTAVRARDFMNQKMQEHVTNALTELDQTRKKEEAAAATTVRNDNVVNSDWENVMEALGRQGL